MLMALLLLVTTFVSQTAVANHHEACNSQQDMIFVCGPQNAEDLVSVDGTNWIIASGRIRIGNISAVLKAI